MRNSILKRNKTRKRRVMSCRRKLRNSLENRARLCVIKTNSHLYAQLIDGENQNTLAAISTLSKEFRNTEYAKKNKNSARVLGKRIAELAAEKNITEVVFDRGRAKYHGLLAELADGAREAGLKF